MKREDWGEMTFVLIGSGRVATHLGRFFVDRGLFCLGVYSRTYAHAEELAGRLGTSPFVSLEQTLGCIRHRRPHYVLLCVSDDSLAELSRDLPEGLSETTFLHTSGSTPMSVFSPAVSRHGVFYPLQTFSKEREVDIGAVSYFLEACDESVRSDLKELAQILGIASQVQFCDSHQRVHVHLSAVFVCNFVNHLYAQAYDILQRQGIAPSTLHGLMRETLEKALEFPPRSVQTGPAVRGDHRTMDSHLSLLQGSPFGSRIYRLLSESIYYTQQNSSNEQSK